MGGHRRGCLKGTGIAKVRAILATSAGSVVTPQKGFREGAEGGGGKKLDRPVMAAATPKALTKFSKERSILL